MYRDFIKPLLDRVISLFVLFPLCPLFLVVGILIKLDSEGPVLYKQVRLGRAGKHFTIYKFRTMIVGAEALGTKDTTYEGDPRITTIGDVLRKSSIDELPQLFNIIIGDMSIIGPRPLLPNDPAYVEYPEMTAKRYSVLPGLFCLVDIDYRAKASRNLQFSLDVEYVNNMSFIYDMLLMWKIVKVIIKRENVYAR